MLLFDGKQYPGYGFDGGEVRNPCHGIARGLEKVLVPYYPLAGRLRPGAERGKLELVCNGQGAVFVEAQANISLAELKRLDKVYWSELQYDFVPEASTEIPPLVIQVTMLSCGGFVVSIRVLQSLCDSAGMLHFLHAWSELTKSSQNFISTTPIWGGAMPKQMAEWPQKFNFPSLDLAHEEVESMAHKQHMELAQNQAYYENLTGLRNVSISLEELGSLKETIRIKCNRFEALAALFWRERTRALGLPPSSEVILFFPAPVAHDVHMAFYGQYAFNCMAAVSAGNLVQSELAEIVRFLQDAKTSLEENFAHVVKEFAKLHCSAKRAPPHVFLFTLLWDGASEIDFGWGTAPHAPDAVRLHSPVNVAAITGGLEDTIEIVMTNAPLTMADKISLQLLPSRSSLKADSRL